MILSDTDVDAALNCDCHSTVLSPYSHFLKHRAVHQSRKHPSGRSVKRCRLNAR